MLNMELENGISVKEFKGMLVERFPVLEPLAQNMLVSINQEFGYDQDVDPGSS